MADSNNHSDRFEELCAGYVLNALEPPEQAEFEAMLDVADVEQKELYQKLRSAANNLSFDNNRIEPPVAVKQRLLQVINEDIEEQPSGKTDSSPDQFNWPKFAIAASFALLLVTLSLLFYTFSLNSQLDSTRQKLAQKEQTITELQQEIDRKDEMLSILEAREVNLVMMQGMEASPRGYGKIIWDAKQQKALLQVSNLPPVPNGMEYQLWIIKDNKPISAGLFTIHDPERNAFFKIEQMKSADEQEVSAFTVTLEPQGGMPKPTGEIYLMGNMN